MISELTNSCIHGLMASAYFSSLKFILLSPLFQIFDLEKYGIGFSFSNLMEEAHFLFSTYVLLVFDSVLYMLLALYFDKILPGRNDLFLFTRIAWDISGK